MWNPKEIRGLVAQIAGILFGGGGIALMIAGVRATGKINISTNLISGEIESGSAGLLLLFLAFFLIVLPSYVGQPNSESESLPAARKAEIESAQRKGIHKKLKIIFFGIITSVVCFIAGQNLITRQYLDFGGFMTFCGYAFGFITGLTTVVVAIDYMGSESEPESKKEP